jgi:hypothetical protein
MQVASVDLPALVPGMLETISDQAEQRELTSGFSFRF